VKKLLDEFKAFAFSGNLVDVAIGIAIGVAFAAVVDSLVENLILALVAAIFGQPDLSSLDFGLNGTTIGIGTFLTDLVGFLLLALVVLFLVKAIKRLTGKEAAGAQGNRECDHCKSFIPVDASVCMYCTRDVDPLVA
jgi:large conductance mechanosensitive channel